MRKYYFKKKSPLKSFLKRNLFNFVLLGIVLVLGLSTMLPSIYYTYKLESRIADLEKRKDKILLEQQELKLKLHEIKQKKYIENKARNVLYMVYPEEKVLLLSETGQRILKKENK